MNFLTHNILRVCARDVYCIHICEIAASTRNEIIKYLHTMNVDRVKNKLVGGIVLNASVFNFYFCEMKRNEKKIAWILSCSFF